MLPGRKAPRTNQPSDLLIDIHSVILLFTVDLYTDDFIVYQEKALLHQDNGCAINISDGHQAANSAHSYCAHWRDYPAHIDHTRLHQTVWHAFNLCQIHQTKDSIKPFVLICYAITTEFQLYLSGDMKYEMRRRKPKHTTLPIQGIFNLPYNILIYRHGMRGTGLWWHCKLYTAGKWIAVQLNVIAVTRIPTPVPRVTYPALYPTELSPHPQISLWVRESVYLCGQLCDCVCMIACEGVLECV